MRRRGPQHEPVRDPAEREFSLEAQGDTVQSASKYAKHKRGLDLFLLAYLGLAPLLQSRGYHKTLVGRGLTLFGMAYLAHALLIFRRWRDEMPHAWPFFRNFLLLVLFLLLENLCIWAASAFDLQKHDQVPALQDNIQQLFALLAERYPSVDWLAPFRHEWIAILHKMVALVALGFSAVFDQVPYSGFGMMSRVCVCICFSRMIRTLAFLLTVVPNPRPGCYDRRFPEVPDTVWEFVLVGYSKIRGMGGCNDLIISGHCTIYAAVAFAFQSFYPFWGSKLIWIAVIRSCIRGPLTHTHYAVDMWLALAVSGLVWHCCDWVYPVNASRLRQRREGEPPDPKGPVQWLLTALVFGVLAVLGVIIILGGA